MGRRDLWSLEAHNLGTGIGETHKETKCGCMMRWLAGRRKQQELQKARQGGRGTFAKPRTWAELGGCGRPPSQRRVGFSTGIFCPMCLSQRVPSSPSDATITGNRFAASPLELSLSKGWPGGSHASLLCGHLCGDLGWPRQQLCWPSLRMDLAVSTSRWLSEFGAEPRGHSKMGRVSGLPPEGHRAGVSASPRVAEGSSGRA